METGGRSGPRHRRRTEGRQHLLRRRHVDAQRQGPGDPVRGQGQDYKLLVLGGNMLENTLAGSGQVDGLGALVEFPAKGAAREALRRRGDHVEGVACRPVHGAALVQVDVDARTPTEDAELLRRA